MSIQVGTYGPWFARITYNDKTCRFEVILLSEMKDIYKPALRLIVDHPVIPWTSMTLKGAKKIAKRELKRKRKMERKAINDSHMVPLEIH